MIEETEIKNLSGVVCRFFENIGLNPEVVHLSYNYTNEDITVSAKLNIIPKSFRQLRPRDVYCELLNMVKESRHIKSHIDSKVSGSIMENERLKKENESLKKENEILMSYKIHYDMEYKLRNGKN